ncbi:type IV secretory system conjugative DNA transfer family protein [Actinomadura oligospora]|uniref:type IV secretory system conjugative DNA transfer family protein n=1 Tax=Actinomadura oligospora TaxID=111804 RepID=UPI0004AECF82|nr:type IV secretion system DNA-binding domain-containing protein [Actinomadura oligospora]
MNPDPWFVPRLLLSWLYSHYLIVAPLLIAADVARYAVLRARHRRMAAGSRCIEIQPPPQADLASAHALWSNLMGLLRPAWARVVFGQPHLAFEYAAFDASGIRIRLWVPANVPDGLAEHAIEAAWPSARTTTIPVDEAVPVPPSRWTSGGWLMLARGEHLPLKDRHNNDPLRALIGAASAMPYGQHSCVQILARPATGRRLASLDLLAVERHARALLTLLGPVHRRVSVPKGRDMTDRADQLEHAAQARAAADKAAQSRYAIAIRYAVAAAPTDRPLNAETEEARRSAVVGRAHAIASAFAVYAGHNRLERRRLRRPAQALNGRHLGRGQLVSISELAALAHLPLDDTVPGLNRAGAHSVAPSSAIARHGPDAKPLGDSDAGSTRPVGLRVADAVHHVHVMGPNGTGKSTLLAQMILADASAGRGTVVIEAKGDLVTDLLGLLPEDCANRVVLIDPDDRHPRPALNVLQTSHRGGDIAMATDNLVGIFRKIYADTWGPRTDDILRGCCLTLAQRGGTLADIPALLTDPAYRRRLTAGLADPLLRGFWNWYEGLSEAAQAHVTSPIMNKLRAFLLRPFVRDVLGSARSTFDMTDILDGGILLVRLPKGVLGDDTARLLGSMILAQAWQAAARRARLGHARAHAAVYVDECHNFLTLPHALSDMLAEARAYRVSLTLAHQYLDQLPRALRQAISSDARNKIYFALSPDDAATVATHFRPTLSAHDLASLAAFQAAARLVVKAAETPPFTLRTRPLPEPDREHADRIRAAASTAHGRRPETAAARPDDPRLTPNEGD